MVGPIPPPLGGATVSFQCLIDSVKKNDSISLIVLSTTAIRGARLKGMLNFINLLFKAFQQGRDGNVIALHCSTTGLPIIAPFLLVISKFTRSPFIIRKFGGQDHLSQLAFPFSWIANQIIKKSDVYLVQTKYLLSLCKERGLIQSKWFPTHRKLRNDCQKVITKKSNCGCKRFIYVGHVRKSKGIEFLIDAAKTLPRYCTIDIYGPLFNDINKDIFKGVANVSYKGVVNPNSVLKIMAQYDALVFPTTAETEGYPGSIVEAFLAGLPIISTNCGAIPELFSEQVGIMIPPFNANRLSEAMLCLNQDKELYQKCRQNVLKRRKLFSDELWAKEFVNLCISKSTH